MGYFPGFTTLQLCNKVQEFMSKMSDPSEFKGRIIFMSMFNDISWGSPDNEQECEFVREDSHQEDGHSSDLDQKRSGILLMIANPQGEWDRVAELMMIKFREKRTPNFPCHESIVPRNAQKQRWWKSINTLLR